MTASSMRRIALALAVVAVLSARVAAKAKPDPTGLQHIRDVAMPGGPTRFDYQAIDTEKGRLYIAHLGSDELLVFDIAAQKIIGQVRGLPSIHGVIAAPSLHKIFVTVTGSKELAIIDDASLAILARIPAGDYPNGLTLAEKYNKVYISNNSGLGLGVVDVKANKPMPGIDIGGGAGNCQYDAESDRVFVTSHQRPELLEIDPSTDKVVAHHGLQGVSGCHGLLIHSEARRAFVACGGGNPTFVAFDLQTKKQISTSPIALRPDVLAIDADLKRIYVSSGTGMASVFDETAEGGIRKLGEGMVGPNTHTVAADRRTHQVFFPIENLNGHPVLRIMSPVSVVTSVVVDSVPPLQEIRTIALPGVVKRIDHLAVDVAGQRLFVAALGNGTVEVIDLQAGKRVRSLPGLNEPQGLGHFPEFHKLVVATRGGAVVAYDDRTFNVVASLHNLDDADNVRYDAVAKQIYVGYGDGALTIINPQTMQILGEIKLPGHPESFRLDTSSPLIYVNVPDSKEVVVVDRDKRTIVSSIPFHAFQQNYPMSLDEEGHRLLIGTRKPARLVVVDTATHKTSDVTCVDDTDDLFFDVARQRVYVIGGQGFVDVFDTRPEGHYARLAHIPTAAGARTGLWVPELNRLYVASPSREGHQAAIHVLQAAPLQ